MKVFNTVGEVELRAKVTANVPEDFGDVRGVVPETEIQRSKRGGGYPSRYGVDENRCASAAIHSQFADIILISKGAAA